MKRYLEQTTSAAPLALFRALFGLLVFAGIVRFWANGWIHDLYVAPKHFFPFFGFEFVRPLGPYTYVLFALCAVFALMMAAGYYYRLATTLLFASFTYIELIDKSTYLNHYYFISMLLLLMIFLPAHSRFSVDAWRNERLRASEIPSWSLDSIRLFVCFLYFFAGLAKVNSDWLLEAQPLRTWLPAKNDLWLIGPAFNQLWVAYAFSWAGCLYDLSIPFLLMNRRTAFFAFPAVIVFHLLTAMLFPIGMFPYIMIFTAVIFLPDKFHESIIRQVSAVFRAPDIPLKTFTLSRSASRLIPAFIVLFFIVQILLPLRSIFYPGELFWTEEGYRFSWRVMLMEKAGFAEFTVRDRNGKYIVVDNTRFLTPLQEKMMATQPDMILQYAHILRDHFSRDGFESPEVYVDSYVALNGRLGRPLVDPNINLAAEKESFNHKTWILPFKDEISGL